MNAAYYLEVDRLMKMPRTGWVRRGIVSPPTFADQHRVMTLFAFDLARREECDAATCAQRVLYCLLPKAKAGDISPFCENFSEKSELETKAADDLAKLSRISDFNRMFGEYKRGWSQEARVCVDADQLANLFLVVECAALSEKNRLALVDFWPYAEQKIVTETGRASFEQLKKLYDAGKSAFSPHP